jgi:hypothetical protein
MITWKWTAHGLYTAKSAYAAQLAGSYCTFDSMAIWRAKTEGKHRFFAWLLVQYKILTADKLLARGWPCQPNCSLCDQEEETAEHLCLPCVFAQEVWMLVSQWTGGLISIPDRAISSIDWWNSSMCQVLGKIKSKRASIIIYTCWSLWKERNRRIFLEQNGDASENFTFNPRRAELEKRGVWRSPGSQLSLILPLLMYTEFLLCICNPLYVQHALLSHMT